VVLLRSSRSPSAITLDGKVMEQFRWSADEKLLWLNFENEPRPRELRVSFAATAR